MTQKTTKKTKKRRRISVSAVILVIGIVIILIPFGILAYLIFGATLGTGTPLFGSRFTNDLNPAITQEKVDALDTSISGLTGVEEASLNLRAATLRITIDTTDTLVATEVSELTKQVYQQIDTALPVTTYFKSDEVKKMYDLEITVYNLKDKPDEANYFQFVLVKNANMETWTIQEVSKPLDPEIAKALQDALAAKNQPTESENSTEGN